MIQRKLKSILLGMAISLFILPLFGEVFVEKNAQVSGTWTKQESPYIIDGLITIPEGKELAIEPGTRIEFKTRDNNDDKNSDFGMMRVKGTLKAEGSEKAFINFTRHGNIGSWGIILFENKQHASLLKYCEIEHSQEVFNIAGFYHFKGAISLQDEAKVNVKNCTIHNNFVGIQVSKTSLQEKPVLQMNCLYQNKIAAVLCYQNSSPIIEQNFIESSKTGILCLQYSDPLIRNNVIQNVNDGIMCYYKSCPNIENNKIQATVCGVFSIKKNSIQIHNTIIQDAKYGVILDFESDLLCENSIISNVKEGGINLDNNSTAIVNNSIVWTEASEAWFYDTESTVTISYSLLKHEDQSNQMNLLKGNILGKNPLFRNVSKNDFHLKCDVFDNSNYSPCIDSGNPENEYNDGFMNWDSGLWSLKNDMGVYGGPKSINWDLPLKMIREHASQPIFFAKNNIFALETDSPVIMNLLSQR